jgi:hypothetical protein
MAVHEYLPAFSVQSVARRREHSSTPTGGNLATFSFIHTRAAAHLPLLKLHAAAAALAYICDCRRVGVHVVMKFHFSFFIFHFTFYIFLELVSDGCALYHGVAAAPNPTQLRVAQDEGTHGPILLFCRRAKRSRCSLVLCSRGRQVAHQREHFPACRSLSRMAAQNLRRLRRRRAVRSLFIAARRLFLTLSSCFLLFASCGGKVRRTACACTTRAACFTRQLLSAGSPPSPFS